MGVKTTLLPVYYHKNKTMHNEYLNGLGCFWSDSVYNINNSKSFIKEKGFSMAEFRIEIRRLRR